VPGDLNKVALLDSSGCRSLRPSSRKVSAKAVPTASYRKAVFGPPAHNKPSSERILIEPTHRKAGRQFYKASLNGEVIVAQSWSPEFAACRTMQKRGLTGRIEFFWPGVPYPGLIVRDLAKGARLRVIEEDRRGPAPKEWRPPKMCRSQEQHPFDEASGHVVQT
jgi:hypothetical protein